MTRHLPIAALLLLSPAVHAQSYLFSVPEAEVTVTVEPDGAAVMHYRLLFENDPSGHPIDVVDVGMPNLAEHEALGASIDGEPIEPYGIRISSVLEPRGSGYEVELGAGTIEPGGSGVFEFTGRERGMVWQDTTDEDLASFRFTPTWFGSGYVSGDTDLVLRVILPIPEADYPAVEDRILWHREGEEFSAKGVMEGEQLVSVAWARTVRLTGPNMFSVSFPKAYMISVRRDTIASAFMRWFSGSAPGRVILGIAILVGFGFVFFIATRGTGWSIFIVLAGAMVVGMYMSPALELLLCLGVIALGGLLSGLRLHRRRRKPRYIRAEVNLEGGGVKRGLTAVEAAVLLDVPVSRILTMVIFGLARRSLVRIVKEDPLLVEVQGEARGPSTWKPPGGPELGLRPYQVAFLEAFAGQSGIDVSQMTLDGPFEKLLDDTATELATFDLDETRSYYRAIVARALRQVQAEAGYEARFRRVDKDLEWLMVDDGWSGSLAGLSMQGRTYHPWWYHGTPRGTLSAPSPAAGGTTRPATSFGDVASSLAGRMEGLSQGIIGSLDGLKPGAGVDLSGADTFTADVFKAMFDGKGGGGGGSGGCACACAGCACACACAGGGR